MSSKLLGKIFYMPESTPIIKVHGRQFEVRSGIPVRKAMKILNITPGSCLIIREGTLITDDEILQPGDFIELMPVISGG